MTMTRILKISLLTITVIVMCTLGAAVVGIAGQIKCTECGMFVDMNSKFTSKIVQGNTTLYFCDIGDFFSYLKRKGLQDVDAQVRDYATGEWIDAKKASYVHAENKFRSPMGWGIAAFKDKISAAESGKVMDFNATALTFK